MSDAMKSSEPDRQIVERAAHLCKADLVTGVVGEFPELARCHGSYLRTATEKK